MRIAVVGATGLVGSKMLQVLDEQKVQIDELIVAASERSVGKEIVFQGKSYKVVSVDEAIRRVPTSPSSRQVVPPPSNMPRVLQPMALSSSITARLGAWKRTCLWSFQKSTPIRLQARPASLPTPTAPPSNL